MQVNYTAEEYELLKRLADAFGCWPARLVHDISMQWAWATHRRARQGQKDGIGSWEGSGTQPKHWARPNS